MAKAVDLALPSRGAGLDRMRAANPTDRIAVLIASAIRSLKASVTGIHGQSGDVHRRQRLFGFNLASPTLHTREEVVH